MNNIISECLHDFKQHKKKLALEKSEFRWGLYHLIPFNDIDFSFIFLDQLSCSGHYNSQICFDKFKAFNTTSIVINLNYRVSEETIIHVINHEVLHHSLHNCFYKAIYDKFVENVIDEWLLEEETIQRGWEGKITIRKIKKESSK